MQLPQSPRLRFAELTAADAGFILQLTNSEGWLRFIGDRGIRSLQDALVYIEQGPQAMYAAHGFGLWRVSQIDTPGAIGLCGLIQRESLPTPDLGFAFLAEFCGRGFATEAAEACIRHAREALGWSSLLAIVQQDNTASLRLLQRLDFSLQPSLLPAAAAADAKPLLQLDLDLRQPHRGGA